jgi:antitoxin CptB
MSPTLPTDSRRKRILYRATHRGTKESDAIVGGYFSEIAATLPDDKLDEADALLDEADLDLIDWIMGRQPVPARWKNTLFDGVLAYYAAMSVQRSQESD